MLEWQPTQLAVARVREIDAATPVLCCTLCIVVQCFCCRMRMQFSESTKIAALLGAHFRKCRWYGQTNCEHWRHRLFNLCTKLVSVHRCDTLDVIDYTAV